MAAVLLAVVAIPAGLWAAGVRPNLPWGQKATELGTLRVDRGDLAIYVVESGALESANNATVKCEVEALIGLVGGTTGQNGRSGGQQGGRGGSGGQAASSSSSSSSSTASGTTTGTSAKSKTGTSKSGTSKGTGASSGSSSGSGGSSSAGASGGSSGGAGGTGGAGGAGATTASASAGIQTPQIQSFSYTVTPHTPLRPAQTDASKTKAKTASAQQGGMGGGGMGGMQERPGSTRILTLLPEGTPVKAGDVVGTLDSSAFRDERQAELIKVAQARSWVEQAEKVLEVNKIELRQYEEGILPQDRLLIDQYIASCQTQLDKARLDLAWARGIRRKGLRSEAQFKSDELSFAKAQLALREALGMNQRLEKFTGPRLITNLKAKLDSIQSDLYAQTEALKLEEDRLKRLNKMIEKCTLIAPREGIVVYANQANAWGRVDAVIREGVTVREGQPIINLPDPRRMRVRAKVNESKVAKVFKGQKALIRIDAFPTRPLAGTVSLVTAIPAPAAGPISDVKLYYAFVDIDSGGFESLRPGLSAEVEFQVDTRLDVTRIPLQAIRWLNGEAYAAVPDRSAGAAWRRIEVGLLNPSYAEVRSGLKPGDEVIADPDQVAAPLPRARSGETHAAAWSKTRARG